MLEAGFLCLQDRDSAKCTRTKFHIYAISTEKKEGIANSGKISAKQGNTNEEDFSQKLTIKKFLKFV
jgi:hypothetical protein